MDQDEALAAPGNVKAMDIMDVKKWAVWICSIGIWLLPLIWIDPTIYMILTVAGLAMGMIFFMIASGLTLIFGLMDVLNMAHGAFFAWGAYVGYSILNWLDSIGWVHAGGFGQSVGSLLLAVLGAFIVGVLLGLIVERTIIREVYGDHLKQILITMGASFVMVEIIKIFWGLNDEVVTVPLAFQGSYDLFDVVVSKFRVVSIIVGTALFLGIQLILHRTKLGIIVRAGVESREIVQIAGYNISRIFTGVFMAGVGLAAVGGTMMAVFREQVYPAMGSDSFFFALMIVIIGGMGSVTGSFLGALMVGLAFNYVAYLMPKLSLGVNLLLMATILLIRPRGLMGKD